MSTATRWGLAGILIAFAVQFLTQFGGSTAFDVLGVGCVLVFCGWLGVEARTKRTGLMLFWVTVGSCSLLGGLAAAAGWLLQARSHDHTGQVHSAGVDAAAHSVSALPAQSVEPSTLAVVRPADTGPQSPSVSDIADAVTKRLQATAPLRGPFPPFGLGGSLERSDFFDIILRDHLNRTWRPVRNPVDVKIDWNEYSGVDLFVEATVRGCAFRFALIDVANGIPALVSPMVAKSESDRTLNDLPEKGRPTDEELRQVVVPIPRSIGVKTYRLAVQPSTSVNIPDTFWIAGQIIFASASLGGGFGTWASLAPSAPFIGRVPNSREASVDWSRVVSPVTTVLAQITIKTMNSTFQSDGQARAIVRDLTSGAEYPTDWVDVTWRGGMGMSNRKNWQVVAPLVVAVPAASGTHRYVLDVEASRVDLAVTALGTLYFRN